MRRPVPCTRVKERVENKAIEIKIRRCLVVLHVNGSFGHRDGIGRRNVCPADVMRKTLPFPAGLGEDFSAMATFDLKMMNHSPLQNSKRNTEQDILADCSVYAPRQVQLFHHMI